MTFIAGLRLSGMTAPRKLDGPLDDDASRVYVRNVLAPTLKRGDIVVPDNSPAHRVAGYSRDGHRAARRSSAALRPDLT